MKREWLALLFAMAFPSVMAWAYFVALAQPGTTGEANQLVRFAYAAGKLLQFTLPFLWIFTIDRCYPRLARPARPGMVAGAAFGLLVAAAGICAYVLLRDSFLLEGTAETLHTKIAQFGLSTPTAYVAFAGFLAIVHSLLEEYYWRWFVFGRLRERVSWRVALVASSVAFMAHHVIIVAAFFPGRFLTMAVPLSLGIACGGGYWAWLYDRTGSLYPAWLSHLLVDAGILAVGYAMVFAT